MRILIATLFVAAALAGCTDGEEPAYASFEDAMAAPGTEFDVEGNMTLKVLQPHPLDSVPKGEQEVHVLAYEDGQPVTDLDIFMAASMPAMGHGCECDEQHPQHVGHGVYVGTTDLFMNGEWQIMFEIEGDGLEAGVPVDVRV